MINWGFQKDKPTTKAPFDCPQVREKEGTKEEGIPLTLL
jgi:hypothetical protein